MLRTTVNDLDPIIIQRLRHIDDSVASELKAVGRDTSISWIHVKAAILEAADGLRSIAGENTPPVRLDLIKRLRRVHDGKSFTPTGDSIHAVLIPTVKGFDIQLPINQTRVRTRFSTAHEIGHTFFYDITKNPPVRLIDTTPSLRFSRREEDICSAFAGELLIPRELVNNSFNSLRIKYGIGTLLHLALRYDVSPEVVARRLLHDLSYLPNAIVIFKEKPKDNLSKYRNRIGKPIRGKGVQSLRKLERELLTNVKHVIEQAPPYDELDTLAALYSNIVKIDWREDSTPQGSRLIILMEFRI